MTAITTRGTAVVRAAGRRRGPVVAFLSLLCSAGCFHETGPEHPDPVPVPTVVSVQVEYVQPNGCIATVYPCSDLVVFFGSWMGPNGPIRLVRQADGHVWTGVVTGVPVNFPPTGAPYNVRVYDPYLQTDTEARFTGQRLTIGGASLTHIDLPGGHDESALVYIDDTGQGHNPF
jgi:hypothetical protein